MKEEPSAPAATMVGLFDDRESLEKALEDLRREGFREDQSGVTMRGLPEEAGKDREEFETVDWATQSLLTVRVEERHEDAERILRRNGATEITWSDSLTASMAGNPEEIVDANS